jgi:hypothetical protein
VHLERNDKTGHTAPLARAGHNTPSCFVMMGAHCHGWPHSNMARAGNTMPWLGDGCKKCHGWPHNTNTPTTTDTTLKIQAWHTAASTDQVESLVQLGVFLSEDLGFVLLITQRCSRRQCLRCRRRKWSAMHAHMCIGGADLHTPNQEGVLVFTTSNTADV